VAIVFSKFYQVAESCSISYTRAFAGDFLDKLQRHRGESPGSKFKYVFGN